MPKNALRTCAIFVFTLRFGLGIAHADFTKSIQATPGVPVQAVATFYFASCTESLGVGSYSINVAPKYGTLSFSTVSGPIPGCPAGSPSLPAAAAFYTLSATALPGISDYFQLYFLLGGQVAEVIDVSVNPEILTISPSSLSNTTSGDPDSVQFAASGAQTPVSWSISAGSLPAGFTLSSEGLLSTSGDPAAVPGDYSFTVEAQAGVSTATQPLALTVLTADCSQKVNVNITQIAVTTNPTLSWNVLTGPQPVGDVLFLTTNNEILGFGGVSIPFTNLYFPFPPFGISINASNALSLKPDVSVYETPKYVYIQNMTDWSGSATYGTGANISVERNAEFSQTDVLGNPLAAPVSPPLLDSNSSPVMPPFVSPVFPFIDSPNANVPVVDKRRQPLTSLSYTKSFTNYIGCYFDSDGIFHTLATVNWSANYSGTVVVPELFGVRFPQDTHFFQDPGNAVTYNIQQGADLPSPIKNGPLANCHQTYLNFPGTIPEVPLAYCNP